MLLGGLFFSLAFFLRGRSFSASFILGSLGFDFSRFLRCFGFGYSLVHCRFRVNDRLILGGLRIFHAVLLFSRWFLLAFRAGCFVICLGILLCKLVVCLVVRLLLGRVGRLLGF